MQIPLLKDVSKLVLQATSAKIPILSTSVSVNARYPTMPILFQDVVKPLALLLQNYMLKIQQLLAIKAAHSSQTPTPIQLSMSA